jgi:hypothetical protein
MAYSANDVTNKCIRLWNANQADCSGFVRAIADSLDVPIDGDADQIVGRITSSADWIPCLGGADASNAATGARLVIGGLTAAEVGNGAAHGHVIVVVQPTGALSHGLYPYAYWGSLDPGPVRANGGKGTTMNFAFDHAVRDLVHYASTVI